MRGLILVMCFAVTTSLAEARPKHQGRHAPKPREIVVISDDDPVLAAPAPVDDIVIAVPPALAPPRPRPRPSAYYFRAGLLHQDTNAGATTMQLPIATPQMADSGVDMQDSQVPLAAIIGYVVPVLDHRLALETILGFPTYVHFQATGALATQSLAPTLNGMPTGIEPL